MAKQVEDAALEADRLHREAYPEQYEDEAKDGDDPNKDTDEDESTKKDSDDGKTDETPPAPTESDGTLVVEEKATDTNKEVTEHKDDDDWKQKYSVLKGKYDSEVPRLHSEMSALRQVVTDLKAQVSEGVKKVNKEDDKTEDKPNEALDFVKREYPDIYSAMISLVGDAKKDKQPDDSELRKRVEAVERVAVDTAEERFYRDLDTGVSDWRTHKDDPRFLTWLQAEDPLTGYSRLQLAQQAQSALDGKRVAKFYKAFIKDVAGDTDKTTKEETPVDKKKGIEKFVAPPSSGGKGASGKTGEDSNIIKTSDIKKFYDDANKGRYRGREAEFAKMEAKIDKAVIDGKVVNG